MGPPAATSGVRRKQRGGENESASLEPPTAGSSSGCRPSEVGPFIRADKVPLGGCPGTRGGQGIPAPKWGFLIWSSFLLRSSHKKDDFAPIRQPSREEMNVLEQDEAERTANPILRSRGGPGPLVSAHL